MNYGFQNEKDFAELFNNKNFLDLDLNSQKFLKDIFGDFINNDEKIICWKNHDNQKADIFIKYKSLVKGISIKCGTNNSVHQESINDFKRYLESLCIPYRLIDYYVSYHYGYLKDQNGRSILTKRLSSEDYKSFYQEQIDAFNKYINKTRIIVDMIDRFIVRGRNSDYDIAALISGTVDDYVWINKYDLYDMILNNKNIKITSPHASILTIGPKSRDLNNSIKNPRERYFVCIRWYTIREDIENFKKKHLYYKTTS